MAVNNAAAEAHITSANLAKGSVLRGYIAQLTRSGKLRAVRARVSGTTRALLDAPPPLTQWIDATVLEELYEAVGAIDGAPGVRLMVREAIRGSMLPLVEPVIQGILRVFGASPAALFTRAELALRSSLQGVETRFVPLTANTGEFEVRYIGHRAPPMAFVAWRGTLEVAYDLCGVAGSVRLREVLGDGAGARFAVEWR